MKTFNKYMARIPLVFVLVLILVSHPTTIHAQAEVTVSGYVTDAKSGETLPYATIYDTVSCKGVTSNEYGFFSLKLPKGTACFTVSYVGYKPEALTLLTDGDRTVTITLEQSAQLDQVTIVGNRYDLGVSGAQMSAIDLPVQQIKAVPAMFGEVDVLKALQLLPGVQSAAEGTAGLLVRGGGQDENLLLLDGVPLYNVNHMFGLFSAFNADAIKNVTLYKGSFPAHYCGRLSSIVDVRMKDGDLNGYHGNVSIGLISSKINIEGPIVKGRTSFNFSARRTYSDILLNSAIALSRAMNKDTDRYMMGYFFYDLNLKLTHKFSDNDRLYISWYNGDDDIYFKYKSKDWYSKENDRLSWKWGNLVAAARWNHVFSNSMFMDLSVNYTQYRHLMQLDVDSRYYDSSETLNDRLSMNSGIYDWTARADFHYSPDCNHEIRFGSYLTRHLFRPNVIAVSEKYNSTDTTIVRKQKVSQKNTTAAEIQMYFEDNMTITEAWKLNAGLSYSLFNTGGRTYNSIEPRLSTRLLLTDRLSAKAGYAYMTQYIHLLSNNDISLPTDLWVPATARITPEHSHQAAAGLFYNIEGIADLSVEGYYKYMDNLLEYVEGASFLAGTTDWQNKVAMGRGWSYGVEFMAQRSVGRLDGWIAYTWGHSRRQFDRPGMVLNNGKPFDAKYDRRHDFNITANYRFSDRFDMSATWIYQTGAKGSLYTQYYDANPDISYSELGYYGQRNGYRLNPYHRLDVSMNWHKQSRLFEKGTRTFNISVFNAYNNMNPFMVYIYEDGYYNEVTHEWKCNRTLRQLTLFPILPTFSYSLSF